VRHSRESYPGYLSESLSPATIGHLAMADERGVVTLQFSQLPAV
jgi:hypothetical protein